MRADQETRVSAPLACARSYTAHRQPAHVVLGRDSPWPPCRSRRPGALVPARTRWPARDDAVSTAGSRAQPELPVLPTRGESDGPAEKPPPFGAMSEEVGTCASPRRLGSASTDGPAMRASGRRISVRARVDRALPEVAWIAPALPPDTALGARGDRVRRGLAVLRRVPLACERGVERTQAVVLRDAVTRAERACAVAKLPRRTALPDVAEDARPPYGLVRVGLHVLRRERAVLGGVPTLGDFRMQRSERGGGGYADARAEGTAVTTGSAAPSDGALPNVHRVFCASPPHPTRRAARDVARCECAVLGRVPFTRELGRDRRQTVRAHDTVAHTKRATRARACTGHDARRPDMIGGDRAPPPHAVARAGDHIARCALAVFGGMPGLGDLRVQRRQRVGDRDVLVGLVIAEGAAGAAHARRDAPHPLVVGSLGALPPDFATGTVPKDVGVQLAIPRGMPLSDEVRIPRQPVLRAIRGDALLARRGLRELGQRQRAGRAKRRGHLASRL
jgi:hypothetical protein